MGYTYSESQDGLHSSTVGAFATQRSYCSCEASKIQKEIDSLQESSNSALHQAWDEVKSLDEKRLSQQKEIEILSHQLKATTERTEKLERKYENAKKSLANRIARSDSGTSNSLVGLINATKRNLSSSSLFALGQEASANEIMDSECIEPSSKNLKPSSSIPGLAESVTETIENDNYSAITEIAEPCVTLDDINALKVKIEARDQEISHLEDILGNNLKMMQVLQEKLSSAKGTSTKFCG